MSRKSLLPIRPAKGFAATKMKRAGRLRWQEVRRCDDESPPDHREDVEVIGGGLLYIVHPPAALYVSDGEDGNAAFSLEPKRTAVKIAPIDAEYPEVVTLSKIYEDARRRLLQIAKMRSGK